MLRIAGFFKGYSLTQYLGFAGFAASVGSVAYLFAPGGIPEDLRTAFGTNIAAIPEAELEEEARSLYLQYRMTDSVPFDAIVCFLIEACSPPPPDDPMVGYTMRDLIRRRTHVNGAVGTIMSLFDTLLAEREADDATSGADHAQFRGDFERFRENITITLSDLSHNAGVDVLCGFDL